MKKKTCYRTITRNFIFMYMNMLKIDIFTKCHRALKWVLLRKRREGISSAVHKWGVKGKEPCTCPLPLWDLPAEGVNGWGAQTLESEDEGFNLSFAITCWAVLGTQLLSIFELQFWDKWRWGLPLQKEWSYSVVLLLNKHRIINQWIFSFWSQFSHSLG